MHSFTDVLPIRWGQAPAEVDVWLQVGGEGINGQAGQARSTRHLQRSCDFSQTRVWGLGLAQTANSNL